MQASIHLRFNGNCEEAFKFYAKECGGTVEVLMNHEGTPSEAQVPAEWRKKIMHGRIKIGDLLIMGGDAPPGTYQKNSGFSVSLSVDSIADAERLYKVLSTGGSVEMPIAETFFAHRFGMLTDRFGTPWMILNERRMA
jgi:PhnB protein